jgi:hypothetical protein
MSHFSSRPVRKKTSPLMWLALWFFCMAVGGVAHLAFHLDEAASKNPPPVAPHPCLICQSMAQNGRSDIFTLTRISLRPVYITYYISRPVKFLPAARKAAPTLVPSRGPPSLLRI